MTRNASLFTLTALALVSAAVIVGMLTAKADAQGRVFATEKAYRLIGEFDVQIATLFTKDGVAMPIGENGTAYVRSVRTIDLLESWAILSKVEGAKEVTFVVPREQIVFINAID